MTSLANALWDAVERSLHENAKPKVARRIISVLQSHGHVVEDDQTIMVVAREGP